MLKIHELTKIYRTDEIQTTALNNISLEVGEGEFIAVMGPSGCGKSALLHVLGLIDCLSSAEVRQKRLKFKRHLRPLLIGRF